MLLEAKPALMARKDLRCSTNSGPSPAASVQSVFFLSMVCNSTSMPFSIGWMNFLCFAGLRFFFLNLAMMASVPPGFNKLVAEEDTATQRLADPNNRAKSQWQKKNALTRWR